MPRSQESPALRIAEAPRSPQSGTYEWEASPRSSPASAMWQSENRIYGEAPCRICGGTTPLPRRRRRRLAPSPRAGWRHRRDVHVRDRKGEAARLWRDATPERPHVRAGAKRSLVRPLQRKGLSWEETSGERDTGEPAVALSEPHRLKPSRPYSSSRAAALTPHKAFRLMLNGGGSHRFAGNKDDSPRLHHRWHRTDRPCCSREVSGRRLGSHLV